MKKMMNRKLYGICLSLMLAGTGLGADVYFDPKSLIDARYGNLYGNPTLLPSFQGAPEVHDMSMQQQTDQRCVLAIQMEEERMKFEARFNSLAAAIAGFAKEYNQGHRQVWPQREAERLKKAMRDIQSLETMRERKRRSEKAMARQTPPTRSE